jgi:hypothetical protein
MVDAIKVRNLCDDLGNAVFGFFEGGFSELLGVSGNTVASITAIGLPGFAVIAGLADLWEAKQHEYRSKPAKALKVGAGIFSIVEGIGNFGHFAWGVPGFETLPVALAVRAGVDLLWTAEKIAKTNRKHLNRAHAMEVFKKLIGFTGWCLVACGNPLGWVFILGSAVLSLLSRTTYLGGQGLFPTNAGKGNGNSVKNPATGGKTSDVRDGVDTKQQPFVLVNDGSDDDVGTGKAVAPGNNGRRLSCSSDT